MMGRQSFMNQKPRREFFKKADLALPIVVAADSAEVNAADGKAAGEAQNVPEWQGRMTAT